MSDALDAIADLVTEASESMMDLYHRTTPEAAEVIQRHRTMRSKENTGEAFFSTFRGDEPNAQNSEYGDGVVHVRVPERLVGLDDEFPSGEQHYRVDTRNLRPEHFVTAAIDGLIVSTAVASIEAPGDQVHRGISIRLSGHAYDAIHDATASPEQIANTILGQRSLRSSLGMHWTTDSDQAREFASKSPRTGSSDLPIILHADRPAPEDIETRPSMLQRREVHEPEHWEQEVPVRKGRSLNVTGVSWRPHEPHPAADADGWVHHDIGIPMQHVAISSTTAVSAIDEMVSPDLSKAAAYYHATDQDLDDQSYVFPASDIDAPSNYHDDELDRDRVFMTDSPEHARQWGKNIYQVKPRYEPEEDDEHVYSHEGPVEIIRKIKSEASTVTLDFAHDTPITPLAAGHGRARDYTVGPNLDPEGKIHSAVNEAHEYMSQRYPQVDHWVSESPDSLVLNKIVIPKEQRGQGVGSSYMQDLVNYADAKGKRVELTPNTSFGASSQGRLENFYKGFGFIPNKGRTKDYAISNTMYRPAQPIQPTAAVAIAALGLPDGMQIDYKPGGINDEDGVTTIAAHRIIAHIPRPGYEDLPKARMEIGHLDLDGRPDEQGQHRVSSISVHSDYRRRGVATALWNHAHSLGLNPKHEDMGVITPDGRAWAGAVGEGPQATTAAITPIEPPTKVEAMRFAAAAEQAGESDLLFHVTASWADVRNKAQAIRAEGGVRILAWKNGELVGHVKGASEIYESTITFVPGSRHTGSWACGCAWAAYSWGRTGQWKKFEGRRCLVPETMISMADGTFKPISEVQVGEYVVTHDGIGQVTDTMVKPFQGDLVALSSDGDPRPITMTGDHEVWGHGTPQRLRKSWQNTKGQGFKFYDESFLHDESPRWIEAGNMQTYDWLTGVVRTHTHGGPFDVSSVLDEYEIEGDRIHAVYRHRAAGQTRYQGSLDATIRPSHALARIAGLYLAEGNIAEQTGRIAEIQFSVSADEADELTKMLDEALADLGSPGRVRQYGRKNHSGKSIRVTNRPLAQLMAVLCGRGVQRGRAKSSIGKRIHPWVMAWSPEHQHTLLDALHWGDGNHGDHSEHVIEKKVFTSDNHLAQQVVDMVHRCGMVASWSGRWQKGGPSSRDKQFWINTVRWSEAPSYSNGRRWNGSGRFAAKITRTEKVPYDGPVHDLTVYPQHSYVANGRVVHNCSHVLALQFEAQAREMFGKEIRLDVDAPHWIDPTIPVKVPGEYDRDKGRHSVKVAVALDRPVLNSLQGAQPGQYMVPISEVKQYRGHGLLHSGDQIRALTEDVKRNGVTHPIIMTMAPGWTRNEQGERAYSKDPVPFFDDGHHRLHAAEQAGLTHVPVDLYGKQDRHEINKAVSRDTQDADDFYSRAVPQLSPTPEPEPYPKSTLPWPPPPLNPITPLAAYEPDEEHRTAAVRTMSPAEYGKLKILDFPKIHDLPALAKQLRQDAPEYYQSLHDDIAANGIKTPVLVDGDTIMSGHHRLSIADELGIHAPVADYNDNDAYSANTTQAPLVRDWMQRRYDLGSMRSNLEPWMWQEPEKTAAAVPAELDPGKPQLDVKDYEGEVGNDTHITRGERGWLPTSAVAQMPGARGEVPGAHARREGADWEDFKSDIAANGIREPLFITVDHNGQPQMSEGNHRRDAAVELGHSHVPVQIRYFGHAEQQGTVHDRTPNQRTATVTINYMRNNGGMRGAQGFGQDVEPWGKYMSEQDPHVPPPDGWEHGQVTFTNPLRLEHEDGGWKQRLSQQHGGLVGKELSQALLAKGHDAVITHDKYGTGEIVDLRQATRTAMTSIDVEKTADMTEHWPPYLTERSDAYGDPVPVNTSRSNARGPVMSEEAAKTQGWAGPYYHGTTKRRAADIRRGGFRQPRMTNREMANIGTQEEVDKGNTHRTFFANNPQGAWDHAVGNHGKENSALLKVYLHPDHIETDKGGGFYSSTQVKDVAHAAVVPEHVVPPQYTTEEKQSAALDPDDYYYKPLPGTEQHSAAVIPEVAGLPSALAYTERTEQAIAGLQRATTTMLEGLSGQTVAGDAIEQLVASHDHLGAAATGMQSVHQALEEMIPLRDARLANPGAGTDAFLLDGGLHPGEDTDTGERVPSGMHGHRGYPLYELDDPKGNSELRDHLIHEHGYERGDIGRSPKQVHDHLHQTEDGVFHPPFRGNAADTVVDHRHKH